MRLAVIFLAALSVCAAPARIDPLMRNGHWMRARAFAEAEQQAHPDATPSAARSIPIWPKFFHDLGLAYRAAVEAFVAAGGHSGRVWSASFSLDRQRVVTAGDDKTARVVVCLNDHGPAHVHVTGRGCEAARRDIARIENMLTDHLIRLCGDWERIHEIE